MVSQSPNYYILLSSLISGIMLLLSIFINNRFQLEREKQQRIWQEKSDNKKWYREKTYDSYKKLVQILTKIINIQFEITNNTFTEVDSKNKVIELNNLHMEFSSEFIITMGGHPNIDCKEFQKQIVEIHGYALEEQALLARLIITQIMEDDSRIKDVNK